MADVREDAMRRGNEMDVNLNIQGGASQGITGNNSNSFGGKQQKTLTEQLKKMAGIDIGVGALLKQSQIFTGFLGNLFAIVGALIDTVLAPLAPSAFKALGHLGKIIPRIGEVASKWIPKIENWVGNIVTKIDRFFKRFDPSWAKKALYILGGLLAANLAIKMMMMTGKVGASVLGLRSGGALNLAGKGVGGLGKLGGSLATRGMGGTIAAGGSALMGAKAIRGLRSFGGGGGGAGGTAVGGTGASVAGQTVSGGGAQGTSSAYVRSTNGRYNPETGGYEPGGGRGMSAGGKTLANSTKPPSVPQGTIKGGIGRLGRMGSMRAMGRLPIIGGVVAGVTGYMGGREQGMSQGKSAARGGFSGGGAIAGGIIGAKTGAAVGAGIGALFGGVGAVPGAAIGGFVGGAAGMIGGGMAGSWGFDKLFGKGPKAGGGGGGAYNMDIGGSSGAAGYRAPLFVAEAAEFWSEQVRKDGAVLDDHTIEVELSKRKIAEEAAAREKGTADWEKYIAHVIKVGSHTGLTSMENDSMDDPDDLGTGGAGAGEIGAGYYQRDPAVIEAERVARAEKNAAANASMDAALGDAAYMEGLGPEASAVAQAEKENREFMAEQKRLNDKMVQDDMDYADDIALKERIRQKALDDAALAAQFVTDKKLQDAEPSTDLLSGEGVYADAIRNDPSALNILLQTDSTDATEKIFVARTIGNKTYQTQVYSGEDPWR